MDDSCFWLADSLKNFSSETTWSNALIFDVEHLWKVLYKVSSFPIDHTKKVVAMGVLAHYCVQHKTMSRKILCLHLFRFSFVEFSHAISGVWCCASVLYYDFDVHVQCLNCYVLSCNFSDCFCMIFTELECPHLTAPSNGHVTYINGTRGYNSMAKYYCDDDYTLAGVQYRFCQPINNTSLLEWSGTSPVCKGKLDYNEYLVQCMFSFSYLYEIIEYLF